jgi:hypothetical protein
VARPIFRLRGRVAEASGEPAAGVFVAVVDADPDLDDLVAVGITDASGAYRVSFTAEAFNQEAGETETTPDLYVVVSRVDGDSITAVARQDFGKLSFASEEDLGTLRLPSRFEIPALGGTVLRVAPGRGKIAKRLRLDDELVGLALEEVAPIVERLTGWSHLVDAVHAFEIVDDFAAIHRARCEKALGRTDLSAQELARLADASRACEASLVAEWDPITRTVLLNRTFIEAQSFDFLKSTLGHELVHVGQTHSSPEIAARLAALQHESWRHRAGGTSFPIDAERESTILLANLEGYAEYIESRYLGRIYTHAQPILHAARKADARFRRRSGGDELAAQIAAMPIDELFARFGSTKSAQYASGAAAYAASSSGEVPAAFDPGLRPTILPDLESILVALLVAGQAIEAAPKERHCAACGAKAPARAPGLAAHLHVPADSDGVDGRPGDEPIIELCASCSHIAPDLAAAYPRIEESKESRAEVLALSGHSPLALRCLVIANLFADHDAREEGKWSLRAAWHDEAAGFGEAAAPIRRRAAACLEAAVNEGYALVPVRSVTSLILAETSRLGGSFERAFEHVLRGLRFARTAPERQRHMLVYELHRIRERDRTPLTCAEALRGFATLTEDRLRELSEVLESSLGRIEREDVRLQNDARPFDTSLFDEAVVFAQDYADERLMIALLRAGRPGVWEAVLTRPRELLPALLRAAGHAEALVWKHAILVLGRATLSFDAAMLEGHDDAVDSVLRRLLEDDERIVRDTVRIAKQLLGCNAAFAPRIATQARAALPNWGNNHAVREALELVVSIAGRVQPRARTLAEMRFAASIRPCAACGKPALSAAFDLYGAKERYSLVGKCPQCKASSTFAFATEGDPNTAECPEGELGGKRPSAIITPAELFGELTRVSSLPAERERALTCIRELAKFPPGALSVLAAPNGERVTADWLVEARNRVLGAVAPPLDRIVRVLLDEAGPPPTVGALEQALGIALTQAEVPASATGRISLTETRERFLGPVLAGLSAGFVVRRPFTTVDDLRARPLVRFTIHFKGVRGREPVEAALRGHFGPPREQGPHCVYAAWIVGNSPEPDGFTLSYVEPSS